MAPGGGRDLTPAVLFTPKAGANAYGPAIVMLDGGLGSNPGRSDEPTRFAAERMAAKGYTVLSLYSHMERGYPLNRLEQTRYDIAAALDFLERMGFEHFGLVGRSYGADAVANYLATDPDASLATPDQRRVLAAVLFDPVTDVRKFVGSGLDGGRLWTQGGRCPGDGRRQARADSGQYRAGVPPARGRRRLGRGGTLCDAGRGLPQLFRPGGADAEYLGAFASSNPDSRGRDSERSGVVRQ